MFGAERELRSGSRRRERAGAESASLKRRTPHARLSRTRVQEKRPAGYTAPTQCCCDPGQHTGLSAHDRASHCVHIAQSGCEPHSFGRVSIVVSIPACHAGDPGSIPGHGAGYPFGCLSFCLYAPLPSAEALLPSLVLLLLFFAFLFGVAPPLPPGAAASAALHPRPPPTASPSKRLLLRSCFAPPRITPRIWAVIGCGG